MSFTENTIFYSNSTHLGRPRRRARLARDHEKSVRRVGVGGRSAPHASGASRRPRETGQEDTTNWQPAAEPDTLEDGAPKQVLRAASPELMKWLLAKLGELGADVKTLTTHDAVHGLGAKWQAKRHGETGFGYGPPATAACIRAITAPGQTSLYYFLTQHPAAEELRTEVRAKFGDDWQRKCFGRATHFLSHSWGMPFAGFISALADVPAGSFVWNDILAINQHGDAGPLARAAMGADLNSLEGVIKHTKRAVLYFHPLDAPAPIQRVWCLYEILTVVTTEGGELTLGFTSTGEKEMFHIAKAFSQVGKAADAKDLKQAKKLQTTIEKLASKKAQATVPADKDMIFKIIRSKKGGHEKFDQELRGALLTAVAGFTSHLELAETARALVAAKSKKAREDALKPFLQALERAGKQLIPPDAIDLQGTLSLGLSGKELTDNHVKGLVQLVEKTQITSLHLEKSHIAVEGCRAVADVLEKTQITTLKLCRFDLGAGHCAAIAQGLKGNSTLRSLDLRHCGLHCDGCEAVAGVLEKTKITSLNLDSNSLGGSYDGLKFVPNMSGILMLAEMLPHSQLTSLSLANNALCGVDDSGNGTYTAEGINALGEALKGTTSLTSLNVSIVAQVIMPPPTPTLMVSHALPVDELKGTKPVESIDLSGKAYAALSGKGVGVASAVIIAACIKENAVLKELNLANNNLSDVDERDRGFKADGINALCDALKGNSTLSSLNLRFNALCGMIVIPGSGIVGTYTAEGIHALCEAIKGNSTLTSLNLGENQIVGVDEWGNGTYTAEGILALCEALNSAPNLTSLNLCYNEMGPKGGAAIAEGLKGNTTLRSLDLSNNVLTRSFALKLVDRVARKDVLDGKDISGILKLAEVLPHSQLTSLSF